MTMQWCRSPFASAIGATVALAGCSGTSGRTRGPLYVGSAGAMYGTSISPASGSTIPASPQTLVLSDATMDTIVLRSYRCDG